MLPPSAHRASTVATAGRRIGEQAKCPRHQSETVSSVSSEHPLNRFTRRLESHVEPRRTHRPPLRAPHRRRPVLGIGTATPRLSWQIPTADAGYAQAAYEVEITDGDDHTNVVHGRVAGPGPRARGRATPLASRESAAGPGPGPRRRDWSEWSEPATRRGRPAHRRRLDRPLRQPARHRRHGSARARCSRGTADLPGGHRAGPPLRHRARRLHRRAQRPARRRRGARARAGPATSTGCATRRTTSPSWSSPARTASSSCSATAGTAAGSASAGQRALYGDRLALLAQLEVTTADGTVHTLRHRRRLDRPRERRSSPTTCTTASAPTCAATPGPSATRSTSSTPTSSLLVAPDGPPVRDHRRPARASRSPPRRPARPSSTSARTWSAGSG